MASFTNCFSAIFKYHPPLTWNRQWAEKWIRDLKASPFEKGAHPSSSKGTPISYMQPLLEINPRKLKVPPLEGEREGGELWSLTRCTSWGNWTPKKPTSIRFRSTLIDSIPSYLGYLRRNLTIWSIWPVRTFLYSGMEHKEHINSLRSDLIVYDATLRGSFDLTWRVDIKEYDQSENHGREEKASIE